MRKPGLLPLLFGAGMALGAVPSGAISTAGSAGPSTAAPVASADSSEPLQEIIIQRPEPRFVAPTRRDSIGRIWAPVYINGRGPFRLVLDSGASHSGVTAEVAQALSLPPDQSQRMLLRGVTGSVSVPTVRINSFSVGDIDLDTTVLPIITDALGGAQGILGTEGMSDSRIYIDFRYDLIIIARSHKQRAGWGFVTIPFKSMRGQLVVVDAQIDGVRAKAIIDTGGQVTIGNLALRDALLRRRSQFNATPEKIEGVTTDVQTGDLMPTPPIALGDMQIRDSGITYADLRIFQYWKLTDEPVILVGMDVLGLMDTLIIDYRRHELQVRFHRGA